MIFIFEQSNYILYAHVNKINKKSYIGITSDVTSRWEGNGRHYNDSPKFWNAINKYGWNNFDHIILESGLTKSEARIKEINTIKEYDSITNGYNISPGGDVPPILKGKDNPNYGHPMSAEIRKKMSKNHADFKKDKHPGAKHVICVETGMVFGSMASAAEYVNGRSGDISACCCGRQHTHKGYHWKYYNKDLDFLNV